MNQSLSISSRVSLQDGHQMPLLGLGVWAARSGKETFEATLYALQTGYRHIDTAMIYGNEKDVGEAVRASGLPRDEVFVTTKPGPFRCSERMFSEWLLAASGARCVLGSPSRPADTHVRCPAASAA